MVSQATSHAHFHVGCCDNSARLKQCHDALSQLGLAVIPRTRVSSSRMGPESREPHLRKVNQEHQDIYAAIERQDPEAARAAMRIHLVNSRERQRQAHASDNSKNRSLHEDS